MPGTEPPVFGSARGTQFAAPPIEGAGEPPRKARNPDGDIQMDPARCKGLIWIRRARFDSTNQAAKSGLPPN